MAYLSQYFLFGAHFPVADGAVSSDLVFMCGGKNKRFCSCNFSELFQFFPSGARWGCCLSFSEGPWNTVWKLEVRLMCQREEKCAWTLVRSLGTLPMGLGVLSRVPLRFWCKAGLGPGASGVRLTQRHPGAHWSLGLGSAHRALRGEGRWLQ